jgi:hypothetical protein
MRTIVAGDWAVYCEEAHVFNIHSHTGNPTTCHGERSVDVRDSERQRGVEPSLAV